jgi:C-methyltransferase C-terminal domain
VQQAQFDTAYHEHYSYLSLSAVQAVFTACGLQVFDVELLPTHGGSLRVYAQRADTGVQPLSPRVATLLGSEHAAGITSAAFYAGFQARAEGIKNDLLHFLIDARRRGWRVAAYGAAAKGNTLLNFAGVRADLLPYVVDRNPAKAGRWMPGSRIPIVGEDHLKADRPDCVLILPWNLRDEVTAQLACVRQWGGCFATAVPELVVGP